MSVATNEKVRHLPRVPSHVSLLHEIGRGAMGSVWAADHRELGRVAIKLVDPELVAAHPEARHRLRFEAEAAWRIDSPNIAKVLERGMFGGHHYIVMELLEGQTLEERIDEVGALPVEDCVWILEEMASALSAAHAQGIVHRDLKPENVFVCGEDPGPSVKLIDFGIAKRPTDGDMQLTRPGTLLGTPYYMSREQLLCSAEVDHRADLWALAVVAYELLTGCVPFMGDNLGYLIRAVFDGDYELVSRLRPELTDTGSGALVDAWFAKAFHRNIDERFSSAEEMVAALRAVLPRDPERDVSGIRRFAEMTEVPDMCQPEPPTEPELADEPTSDDIPMQRRRAPLVLAAAFLSAAVTTVAAFI